jgi:YHS domain-containing protein
MKSLILTVAALAILSASAFATPTHAHKAKMVCKPGSYICPVTGTAVASAKVAAGHETYKGKTYYFCCPECKPLFDKNPAGIISNAAKGKYEKM